MTSLESPLTASPLFRLVWIYKMSHYATVEMEFKFEEELIQALRAVYGEENVEVHQKEVDLMNWNGVKSGKTANIIVRKQFIHNLSNDLGFQKTETGYRMFVDQSHSKTKEIVSEYATRVMKNRLPRGKYRIKEQVGNKIVLQVR